MSETLSEYGPLLLAALAAGVVNALAGGGTLLTFPVLTAVLGVSEVLANGTNTVALVPGAIAGAWAYRHELGDARPLARRLIGPSIVGGWIGAALVTQLPDRYFKSLVPWLILSAVLLFLMQPAVARLQRTEHRPWPAGVLLGFQLAVAIYGGYFGAGMGIIILAALAFSGLHDIHQMNAVKTIQAATVNTVAAIEFARTGDVHWRYAAVMSVAAIVGGFLGAHYGRKLSRTLVRGMVVGIGLCLTVYYFARR